ncbi:MAG: methionyl-tRNA formyltransferase [Kiritimatiellia bacterium]
METREVQKNSDRPMKMIFMGSAEFAVPSLNALLAGPDKIQAVVTRPPKPRGRNRGLSPCPLCAFAGERGLPMVTPANVSSPDTVRGLEDLAPDVIIVIAYGQLLKKRLLDIPRLACINVHASLLPKYRGAAPIQWAIAGGENLTGVTTMYMSEGMDEGDVILQETAPITREDTAASLHDRLAASAAGLLKTTLGLIREGKAPRKKQNSDEATYAPKLNRQDGQIDWTLSAEEIYNKVRGFNPWPGCWCRVPLSDSGGNKRLKILKVEAEKAQGEPGTLLETGRADPVIAAGKGSVRLLCVQPEGGRRMSGAEYFRGLKIRNCTSFK